MFGRRPLLVTVDSRINILHLRASNFIGGPEKQILEHFARTDRRRFNLILCTFDENGKPDYLRERAFQLGFHCCSIVSGTPFDIRSVSQLYRILRCEKINILCTHGYKPNVVGRIAAWLARVPEVAVSRGWTSESLKVKFYEKLDKLFLRFTDHVVAVSHGQKKKIHKLGLPPHKVSVIYNGVDFDDVRNRTDKSIRDELGIDAGSVLVISAGRLSPEKNFSGLIDAAKIVVEKDRNIKFVVFGEGTLRKGLEKKIQNYGLRHRFFLPGFRKDFISLLNDADIFVLPSFTEGLSNVILEAYASKKPVIATRVGGNPEVVMNGETGYLVEPDNAEKMAECIITLAQNPDLRATMGNRGYEYIKNHFNFDLQTQKYEALYKTIYNNCNAG